MIHHDLQPFFWLEYYQKERYDKNIFKWFTLPGKLGRPKYMKHFAIIYLSQWDITNIAQFSLRPLVSSAGFSIGKHREISEELTPRQQGLSLNGKSCCYRLLEILANYLHLLGSGESPNFSKLTEGGVRAGWKILHTHKFCSSSLNSNFSSIHLILIHQDAL